MKVFALEKQIQICIIDSISRCPPQVWKLFWSYIFWNQFNIFSITCLQNINIVMHFSLRLYLITHFCNIPDIFINIDTFVVIIIITLNDLCGACLGLIFLHSRCFPCDSLMWCSCYPFSITQISLTFDLLYTFLNDTFIFVNNQ